jgi:nicotinamidase-related amidase
MTTLTDRPATALLVIDMQNGIVADAWRREQTITNIRAAVSRARDAGVPVVWIQHSAADLPTGSDPWQQVAELTRDDTEPVIHKQWGDSFEDTDLETVLAERGVGSLVITGASTEACVRCTLHGALTRGYDALLVSDAHTTTDMTSWGAPGPEQVVSFTNLYWQYTSAPGRTAGTVTTTDLDFARKQA